MTKQAILDSLRIKNIHLVDVVFSGGNDEGGVDDILVYINGQEEPIRFDDPSWTAETPKDNNLFNKDFLNSLVKPVYDKYYGFAGDFQVYGNLIWNVKENSVKFDGQESSYNHFESNVD